METTVKRDELFNGVQVGIVAREVELPAGTWERGMLLGKVGGVYNQIGVLTFDANTFDCVLADDATLAATGKAVAYFAGEFNEDLVKVTGAVTVADVKDHARKLQIYFD